MPEPVFITLGSNIDPHQNLRRAVQMIGQKFPIQAASRVYETAPIDAAGNVDGSQAAFLNAAVLITTDKPPAEIKYKILRFLETMLGRVRTADKFAARTIDLDLALYGDRVIDSPRLVLPDPDILTRAHVALPLADLAPDFRHPVTGQTLAAIAASFAGAGGITVRDDLPLLS
ncbi:MAG: 2-amino-4-hydroxy-6-hydroxymethyldihydropteridine diphosphokinase [Chloroflexi bacterium]|nr:2-amino-4-hydroxy-6-hydroxymethyldihydropteridine diphosphokinase [Chloroflexota bacterium]